RLPPQNTRTVHNLTPSLRISPLYPYTTLFRSHVDWSSVAERAEAHGVHVGGFTDQHHFITGIISELPAPLEDADAKTKRALQTRSEEHTSELQSREKLVCRLLLEKKKKSADQY